MAIAPGPIFSARNRFGNFIRVSCGMPWSASVEAALTTVGTLAHELLPRPRAAPAQRPVSAAE
ncbi:MAG: hypothetical protein U1F43_17810 [Myxococcota bacterium]